jgi:hypothetical protein
MKASLPLAPAAPAMTAQEVARALAEVRAALSAIRYGSIEIAIQDGRVVQIERREKVRFDRQTGGAR